jgi:hypothetical protein
MHKSATKCNETLNKWCKNKHRASKIIDTFETYQSPSSTEPGDHHGRAWPPSSARSTSCRFRTRTSFRGDRHHPAATPATLDAPRWASPSFPVARARVSPAPPSRGRRRPSAVDPVLIGRTALPRTASAARATDRWPPLVSDLNPPSRALAPELGWPSSDPAEPLQIRPVWCFFQKTAVRNYLNLLDYKIYRIFSECPNLVIQILMWTLQYCLASSTACMIFRTLEIIWDLFVVDLGFYHHKSKSGVLCDKNVWFQFSEMPCCNVKLENLVLLF